jgi:mannosyltransferase OCH1-like enzyme
MNLNLSQYQRRPFAFTISLALVCCFSGYSSQNHAEIGNLRQGRQLMSLSRFIDPASTVLKETAQQSFHQQPCVTLSCLQASDPNQIDWENIFKGQPTKDVEVPRILHQMILGDNYPPSMLKLVEWNFQHMNKGYQTKLWRDADVDQLMDAYGDRVRQMWQHAKGDQSFRRGARLADIARVLILFAKGGIYIDADTIICNRHLDRMVNKPGVVSFPFQRHNSNQVTVAAASAPPGHRLFGMAMEFFINQGAGIGFDSILEATGPHGFAKVVDEYIKEMGIKRPPIYGGSEKEPGGNIRFPRKNPMGTPVTGGPFWAVQTADLRFGNAMTYMNMWHVGFASWTGHTALDPPVRPCDENLDLVFPWMDKFCAKPYHGDGEGCFNQCNDAPMSPGCHFFDNLGVQ